MRLDALLNHFNGKKQTVVHQVILLQHLPVFLDLCIDGYLILRMELDEVVVLLLLYLLDVLHVQVLESACGFEFLGHLNFTVDD